MLLILSLVVISLFILDFRSSLNDREEWLEHEIDRGVGYKLCASIVNCVIGVPAILLLMVAGFIWLGSKFSMASEEAIAQGETYFYWGAFLLFTGISLRQWGLPWIFDKLEE